MALPSLRQGVRALFWLLFLNPTNQVRDCRSLSLCAKNSSAAASFVPFYYSLKQTQLGGDPFASTAKTRGVSFLLAHFLSLSRTPACLLVCSTPHRRETRHRGFADRNSHAVRGYHNFPAIPSCCAPHRSPQSRNRRGVVLRLERAKEVCGKKILCVIPLFL